MTIWERIQVTGFCWLWTGALDVDGYGRQPRKRGQRQSPIAHRRVYEELIGPIGPGLELDHLCRIRACVNPDHLEPVSHAENSSRTRGHNRATHCRQGHAFTPDNSRERGFGQGRACKTCDRAAVARYKARKRVAA